MTALYLNRRPPCDRAVVLTKQQGSAAGVNDFCAANLAPDARWALGQCQRSPLVRLISLAGSLCQYSERNREGCQCRRAFEESSGPEELLALHHYTQS